MAIRDTPANRFLQRVNEFSTPLGYPWRRGSHELRHTSKDPRRGFHFNMGQYPELLRLNLSAYIGFAAPEIVQWQVLGYDIAESRKRFKEGASLARAFGSWKCVPDDFDAVLEDVRRAIEGPGIEFHRSISSVDDVMNLWDRFLAGEKVLLFLTPSQAIAHLAIPYIKRDRARFESTATAWSTYNGGSAEIADAAQFLRERWDPPLPWE